MLKHGKSRQDTYLELKAKYGSGKVVVDVIENLPSLEAKKKYGIWNYFLLALLLLITALFMRAAPSIGIVIWYGLLIYAVARVLTKYYIWVTIMTAIAIAGGLAAVVTNDLESVNWSNAVIFLILNVPALILPIWLERKLCPAPTERREKYTNKEGKQKIRVVYEFRDV